MADRLLTPEEIDQIYFECGVLNKPSLSYLNEILTQHQDKQTAEIVRAEERKKIVEAVERVSRVIDWQDDIGEWAEIPDYPNDPCGVCGCEEYWLRTGYGPAKWLCRVCYPEPVDNTDLS